MNQPSSGSPAISVCAKGSAAAIARGASVTSAAGSVNGSNEGWNDGSAVGSGVKTGSMEGVGVAAAVMNWINLSP